MLLVYHVLPLSLQSHLQSYSWILLFLMLFFFLLFNRSAICVCNVYLVHIPTLDFKKESKLDMWSTVGLLCYAYKQKAKMEVHQSMAGLSQATTSTWCLQGGPCYTSSECYSSNVKPSHLVWFLGYIIRHWQCYQCDGLKWSIHPYDTASAWISKILW